MVDQAKIRLYGTTANLASGFDNIGGKLLISCGTVTASKRNSGLTVVTGEDYPVPTDKSNLVYQVAYGIDNPDGDHINGLFEDYEIPGGIALKIEISRKKGGLGTSATGGVSFVELVNRLYELKLEQEQVIQYALLGEPNQHPDNVVPLVKGGIVISSKLESRSNIAYTKLSSPEGLVPVIVSPENIETGDTKEARVVLDETDYSLADTVNASGLALLMQSGIRENDFKKVWDSIHEYDNWSKSVTFVRNEAGVYGIDVGQLNRFLLEIYGNSAILTPSGAGPRMLILAKDPEIAKEAGKDVERMYGDLGELAKSEVVSFRDEPSSQDFIGL